MVTLSGKELETLNWSAPAQLGEFCPELSSYLLTFPLDAPQCGSKVDGRVILGHPFRLWALDTVELPPPPGLEPLGRGEHVVWAWGRHSEKQKLKPSKQQLCGWRL